MISGTMKSIANAAAAARAMAHNVPSPCISYCRMDEASGLCQGCFRTLQEITQWSRMDDGAKRAVWAAVEQRAAD